MEMYVHYKNGLLPVAGGALNQSATFLKAVELLDSIVNKIHHDEMEAEKAKWPKKN